MTVSCPDCRSVFRVDPAKVPATGVRARCSVCGGVIAIAGGTLPISVTPASIGAVSAAGGAPPRPARPTPARSYTPAMPSGTVPASAPSFAPTFAPPAASHAAPVPMPTPAPSLAPSVSASPTPAQVPPAVAPGIMTPPAPARLPISTPGYAATPVTVAVATPMSTPIATSPVATTTAAPTPRRSINPFLNADPGQRARRLARALVSDLVAYHPQKREEGLRDGTLRQLFREDIKKSYEEYVEQVGRDVAESSPHFQEALNEILGGGRKLF